MLSLTRASYRLDLPPDTDISELVIFPFSDNDRRGIEEMRLVHFADDDGSCYYYGTYTAFDGFRIYPQLLAYQKGQNIRVHMFSGSCAKTRGWHSSLGRSTGSTQWLHVWTTRTFTIWSRTTSVSGTTMAIAEADVSVEVIQSQLRVSS